VAIENPGTFDRQKFTADLKKMVEAGVAVVGEIPYKHYTFIVMGEGRGGLEHRNSMAAFSSGSIYNPENPAQYKGWLSFLAHEYFHLYNVKSIRPIALGPFDYDKENYTHMLWFSEGVTVYYEYLILNRAGLMTRTDCLERLRRSIANYENIPAHLFQSATEASFDTWIQFFSRGDNARNTTISYYDKGCALGMLLDLKIRQETENKKSLDDVMKALYRQFYKEKQRGFTDEEFRAVCEGVAGCALPEIFDVYASTVKDIGYPKYLAYAGLDIDVAYKDLPGAFLGATTQERGGDLEITGVERDSPAWRAGLSAQDAIIAIDGVKATSQLFAETLKSKKQGEEVKILISHRDLTREVEVVLGTKMERSFQMTPMANPSPLQSAILSDWLKE
jgi:predicted metalloprotease with PDZ domain